ncbi:increased loss of mitochondrial DNA protein 1 [Pyronema omphalodes]|nr:increased loss of mitochondrial DNA protein 1 [Pyronema omphalodes]
MGLIKAYYLVRVIAAVHILMGYLLLAAPQKLANQSTIMVLGEALGLPQPKSSFVENPLAAALAGLVFILFGITDIFALTSEEEVTRDYWGAQAPIRTLFFAIISGYGYLMKPGRANMYTAPEHPIVNSVVFSWAFMEVIWWFWVYTVLREEKGEAYARIFARKKAKMEMMMNED